MTTYPAIEAEAGRRWLSDWLSDDSEAGEPPMSGSGRGPALDMTPLEQVATDICSQLPEDVKRKELDAREAEFSVALYDAVTDYPTEVLDDPSFWHYVSLAHLIDFIIWRQPTAFGKGPGQYSRYVDGTKATECVPLRMFNRGRLARAVGEPDLATAVEEGTDFWRSHIIRVSVGFSPVLTKALVDRQANRRLSTNPLREAAKLINRSASNLLVPVLDDEHAGAIVEAAWQEFE